MIYLPSQNPVIYCPYFGVCDILFMISYPHSPPPPPPPPRVTVHNFCTHFGACDVHPSLQPYSCILASVCDLLFAISYPYFSVHYPSPPSPHTRTHIILKLSPFSSFPPSFILFFRKNTCLFKKLLPEKSAIANSEYMSLFLLFKFEFLPFLGQQKHF